MEGLGVTLHCQAWRARFGSTPLQRVLKHASWKLFLKWTQRELSPVERCASYQDVSNEVRRYVHFEEMSDKPGLLTHFVASTVGNEVIMYGS